MKQRILLCCDLDRTVLPNGPQTESPLARPLFHAIAARKEVTLVYVSGRDKNLLQHAIRDYRIPVPDYAIGDVGTTIYHIAEGNWEISQAWDKEIAQDWHDATHQDLCNILAPITTLQLQEAEKQNTHKISYYVPADIDKTALLADVEHRLQDKGIRATLTFSIDEMKHQGLLDVLPASASKLHAIRFLASRLGYSEEEIVFAGDSGNDLPVLVSPLKAILVNNALPDVKQEAQALAEQNKTLNRLYLARGKLPDLNGNYTAGIIEGLVHYFPFVNAWLKSEKNTLTHSQTIH